ncbi:MAG: hypothetical protein ACOCQX_04110 [Candidatus Nanoarchaeia archaeon]
MRAKNIRNKLRNLFNKIGNKTNRFRDSSGRVFRQYATNYADWFSQRKDRFKKYARNTIAAGVIASAVASGVFFTNYFNNKDKMYAFQEQRDAYVEMMETRKTSYNTDDLSDMINEFRSQKENINSPQDTYTVEEGDSLSAIAMKLNQTDSLSWAEKTIKGEKLEGQEKKVYDTFTTLCKKAGKENLFTKENLAKYGPQKGYPTKGPNYISKNHGDINIEETAFYQEKEEKYKKEMRNHELFMSKLRNIQEKQQEMQEERQREHKMFEEKKADLEERLKGLKDNWHNLGWGIFFCVPPLGAAAEYLRRKKRFTTQRARTYNPEGGGNPGGEDEPIDVEFTVKETKYEPFDDKKAKPDASNYKTGPNQQNEEGVKAGNYNKDENLEEKVTAKKEHKDNKRAPFSIKNPYKGEIDKKRAEKRLAVYEAYNRLWHDKYSENGARNTKSIIQELENDFGISKSTIYNYVNWVDNRLCSNDKDNITDYVRSRAKQAIYKIDEIDRALSIMEEPSTTKQSSKNRSGAYVREYSIRP